MSFSTTDGYVDLGLPSGLLWADCNLGATTPEGYGDYYAWGEVTTKENYSWNNYIWCNGSDRSLTKYCDNSSYGYNGFTDTLTTLQPSDDVATAVLGNGARIPTMDEWNELRNNTTIEWTTRNGVAGRKFTAANGNSIFLPAAGLWDPELGYTGSGNYWSSSLFTGRPGTARRCIFSSMLYPEVDRTDRYCGLSVRAVRASQN